MGKFYIHREKQSPDIWLHSERGIMSYLVFKLLFNDTKSVLEKAINKKNKNIFQSCCNNENSPTFTIFSEFELGSNGFGSPDAGDPDGKSYYC
ncbi:MAG: hypothetical protein SCARUB_04975 [Candidatus Scalindua rubra]|uniref:Uncharacterized protein n=1 Tax=Candidatus Scalindua rubra TaxID=1872076 RepID=A0A1E3X2N5_9BACT|nr:MAG: hypothetical protein SCARUB_04975 [Candidatus Scalindua rubra]